MAWRFLLYLRITCSKIFLVSETSSNFAALDNPRQAFAHCAVGDFQCLHLIGKFTYRSVSSHSFEVSIPPTPKKKYPEIINFYAVWGRRSILATKLRIILGFKKPENSFSCLLYTSDAADE